MIAPGGLYARAWAQVSKDVLLYHGHHVKAMGGFEGYDSSRLLAKGTDWARLVAEISAMR